jgi:hypothetical protein
MEHVLEWGCEWRLYRHTKIDAQGIVNSDQMVQYRMERTCFTSTARSRWCANLVARGTICNKSWPRTQLDALDNAAKTGHSLQSFREDEDSITLHCENGATVRANAVISCDGVLFRGATTTRAKGFTHFLWLMTWIPPNCHPICMRTIWSATLRMRANPTDTYITHDGGLAYDVPFFDFVSRISLREWYTRATRVEGA